MKVSTFYRFYRRELHPFLFIRIGWIVVCSFILHKPRQRSRRGYDCNPVFFVPMLRLFFVPATNTLVYSFSAHHLRCPNLEIGVLSLRFLRPGVNLNVLRSSLGLPEAAFRFCRYLFSKAHLHKIAIKRVPMVCAFGAVDIKLLNSAGATPDDAK